MIYENQDKYYSALNESNTAGESTKFTEFVLQMIRDVLFEIVKNQDSGKWRDGGINDGINDGINLESLKAEDNILLILQNDPYMTAENLATILGKSKRQIERKLSVLKAEKKLERIGARKNGCWKVIKRAEETP